MVLDFWWWWFLLLFGNLNAETLQGSTKHLMKSKVTPGSSNTPNKILQRQKLSVRFILCVCTHIQLFWTELTSRKHFLSNRAVVKTSHLFLSLIGAKSE